MHAQQGVTQGLLFASEDALRFGRAVPSVEGTNQPLWGQVPVPGKTCVWHAPNTQPVQPGLRVFLEAGVGTVAVALDGPAKVCIDDFVQPIRSSASVPVVDGIATGNVAHPEVALWRFTRTGLKATDGRFVDLQIGMTLLLLA